MSKIIVLGGGMVGSAMALDLASSHHVIVADISESALEKIRSRNKNILTVQADLSAKPKLKKLLEPFQLVVSAVPGFMGYSTLETILESKKNVVDISFFPENALELDTLAKRNKVTAIVDCGVAPGMDNILLGYYNEKMKIDFFECLVGGLPKARRWPFMYKAPFSPLDVIEEYIRPARLVEGGKIVTKPALTEPEYIEFEHIGTLEAFNTDGLRSIIYTMSHIPDMREKTLRYPGHIEYIRALKACGFFDKEKMDVKGVSITPLDFSSKLLFKEWKLNQGDEEFTVMRVTMRGTVKNKKKTIVYNLFDQFDSKTNTSSMARTTGYTATAAANMIFEGLFKERGVFPPELVGKHEKCFHYIVEYLAQRNVFYQKHEE